MRFAENRAILQNFYGLREIVEIRRTLAICEEQGKLQIEVLCNLDKVPAAGAILFASWPNFEGANGLPCRVFAVCEE